MLPPGLAKVAGSLHPLLQHGPSGSASAGDLSVDGMGIAKRASWIMRLPPYPRAIVAQTDNLAARVPEHSRVYLLSSARAWVSPKLLCATSRRDTTRPGEDVDSS
jgi:hypothetical protein